MIVVYFTVGVYAEGTPRSWPVSFRVNHDTRSLYVIEGARG